MTARLLLIGAPRSVDARTLGYHRLPKQVPDQAPSQNLLVASRGGGTWGSADKRRPTQAAGLSVYRLI